MKKIVMLALVCSLATGAFANNSKPKKAKKAKQCTEQTCKPCSKPDYKPTNCCKTTTACTKA